MQNRSPNIPPGEQNQSLCLLPPLLDQLASGRPPAPAEMILGGWDGRARCRRRSQLHIEVGAEPMLWTEVGIGSSRRHGSLRLPDPELNWSRPCSLERQLMLTAQPSVPVRDYYGPRRPGRRRTSLDGVTPLGRRSRVTDSWGIPR